jgi:endonuclease-3
MFELTFSIWTKDLFQKYKTPEDYLNVDISELENDLRTIGLYRFLK